jgi:hypothetical protein
VEIDAAAYAAQPERSGPAEAGGLIVGGQRSSRDLAAEDEVDDGASHVPVTTEARA